MREPQDVPDFTPVNLISGFLGSGKTTLLKRMLASPALAGTAVLINEFGEVGLDHELIERVDENTVLLQSGCLCCTIRGELAEAIKSLHSRRARGEIPIYRRLMIESTGLADPLPILHHHGGAGVASSLSPWPRRGDGGRGQRYGPSRPTAGIPEAGCRGGPVGRDEDRHRGSPRHG
jgi:hypothetical protein